MTQTSSSVESAMEVTAPQSASLRGGAIFQALNWYSQKQKREKERTNASFLTNPRTKARNICSKRLTRVVASPPPAIAGSGGFKGFQAAEIELESGRKK
jgi:hypothetical protein